MKIYNITKEGSFLIDDMKIPNNEGNRHYTLMREEELTGDAVVNPYLQDLENLRAEKTAGIKTEGLKRIQSKVDAIDSIAMAKLVYKHMWPQPNASQDLLDGETILNYAISRVSIAKTATRTQLENYDPTTDTGWPS